MEDLAHRFTRVIPFTRINPIGNSYFILALRMACVGSRRFREPSVPARSGLGVFSVRPVAGRFVILQVSEMLRQEMPLRDVQKIWKFVGIHGVSGVFQ